ncbi:MAG: SCO family protein [Mariprofundaceae bacterium]|nr:SCO family protein [Mariprofundaceae bacterium]
MRIVMWIGVLSVFLLLFGMFTMKVHKPEIPSYLKTTGGDFQLESAQASIKLSDFHGHIVLLYFGYSHCPDICPATLNVMASAIRLLQKDEQNHVDGLFVSLDPERDSPAKLKAYTAFFSPKIIGVTGKREQLDAIAQQWRFTYVTPQHPKTAFYIVQHPNFLYVLNKEGHVVALLDEKSTPEDVAKVVRLWL